MPRDGFPNLQQFTPQRAPSRKPLDRANQGAQSSAHHRATTENSVEKTTDKITGQNAEKNASSQHAKPQHAKPVSDTAIDQAKAPRAERYTGPGALLIKITQNLTDVIKQETRLMMARRPQEAGKLHGEKNKLMSEYRHTLNHLQVNQHLLGADDSPIRKRIREVTDQFREELRNHARVVLRLKTVAEGIVKSVGEEVTKQKRPVMSYGSNAHLQAPQNLPPTSLSLNQVI